MVMQKKRVSLEKPYVRTNHQILSKTREFIDKGMSPKQVYDQINKNQVEFLSLYHKARS